MKRMAMRPSKSPMITWPEERKAGVISSRPYQAIATVITHHPERSEATYRISVSQSRTSSVWRTRGYITVGLYPDHQPGEIFITMAKEGSTVSGLISSFAQALSIALQHGVPLKLFCDKFSHTRFEPSGWTGNPEIGQASSVMDYIFRWLRLRFCGEIPTGMVLSHPLSSRGQSRGDLRPSFLPSQHKRATHRLALTAVSDKEKRLLLYLRELWFDYRLQLSTGWAQAW